MFQEIILRDDLNLKKKNIMVEGGVGLFHLFHSKFL